MGKYIDANLSAGEQVVHETKVHWIIFLSPKAILTLYILPFLKFFNSECALTNKRVIVKSGGFFSTKTIEMNISKIESVNVEQGLFGRIFGYGTVTVVGSGGTKESFDQITDPLLFRKKFHEVHG